MNLYSIIGFGLSCGILFYGLVLASKDLSIFLDFPSLFIVVGGTFGAVAISIQLNRFTHLIKIFFNRWIRGKKINMQSTIKEMMTMSDSYRKGESFSNLKTKTPDFFLQDALTMLEDGVLTQDEVVEIMEERNDLLSQNYMEEANRIKTVGKYPPAFGMIGTVIGMIVLLANLGGEDAMKMIGPAMGVCLITTLYGAVIANMIFIPIGDNLTDDTKELHLKNQIVLEGVKLMLKKSNPIVVAERLNSYVKPGERVNWKEIVGK